MLALFQRVETQYVQCVQVQTKNWYGGKHRCDVCESMWWLKNLLLGKKGNMFVTDEPNKRDVKHGKPKNDNEWHKICWDKTVFFKMRRSRRKSRR